MSPMSLFFSWTYLSLLVWSRLIQPWSATKAAFPPMAYCAVGTVSHQVESLLAPGPVVLGLQFVHFPLAPSVPISEPTSMRRELLEMVVFDWEHACQPALDVAADSTPQPARGLGILSRLALPRRDLWSHSETRQLVRTCEQRVYSRSCLTTIVSFVFPVSPRRFSSSS